MSALRKKMIREMQLRQFSSRTIQAYLAAVQGLAVHYDRSPDHITCEQMQSYLHHLLVERKLSSSTCHQRAAGLTFFYHHVLGRETVALKIRRRRSGRLPEVLSRQEVRRLICAAANYRDRAGSRAIP